MSDNLYLFQRILQVGSVRHLIEPGERPPYPIIVEAPQVRDVIANMHLPEFVPFLVSIPLGAVIAYSMTSPLQFLPLMRRRCFGVVWGYTAAYSLWLGFKGSYYKLTGFEDNGLRWKNQEPRIKKYDFTSDLKREASDLFRRKGIDGSKMY
jgi:hypothetical protein